MNIKVVAVAMSVAQPCHERTNNRQLLGRDGLMECVLAIATVDDAAADELSADVATLATLTPAGGSGLGAMVDVDGMLDGFSDVGGARHDPEGVALSL